MKKAAIPKSVRKPAPKSFSTDWKELPTNVRVLTGLTSQAHRKYKGRNEQDGSIAIVANAFASLNNSQLWVRAVLDQILDIGTSLHLKTRTISSNKCRKTLDPQMIHKYFLIGDIKVSTQFEVEVPTIKLKRDTTLNLKFEDFLVGFFKDHTYAILGHKNKFYALWKNNRYFCFFDPFDHESNGSKWRGPLGSGFSALWCFASLKSLVESILPCFPLGQITLFKLYPFSVESFTPVNTIPPDTLAEVKSPITEKSPQQQKKTIVKLPKIVLPPIRTNPPVKPKLASVTKFKEIVPQTVAILQGSLHQRNQRFQRPGEQSFQNAVAALILLRFYKAKTWLTNIVDDVIMLGEKIFQQSEKLPDRVPDKIQFKDQEFTAKIDKIGMMGRLQSSNDKILNLEQALSDFLIDNDRCIIEGPSTLAVWKEDNRYYMFDPEERDDQGLISRNEPGAACLTAFSNIKALVAKYLANISQVRIKDRFTLCKVTIEDYVPNVENWFNFRAVTYNKWILRGNISQQDRRFDTETRNSQCTANAALALVYKELKSEHLWDTNTIDKVLINGDEFYQGCIQTLQNSGRFKDKSLMVDELNRSFDLEDKRVLLEIDDCLVNGVINAKSETGILNLRRGFEEFFLESEAGIVTANLQSMAVWKRNDTFYYYDSHSLNDKGVGARFGTACILRLLTIDDLTKALTVNLGASKQNFYNISRIVVNLVDLLEDGVVKPPLNHYEEITEFIAILRAAISQNDDKFEINAKKQTIPNCLAAVGFNTLLVSSEWTMEDLNEILGIGDKLYVESMADNYGDVPEELNVDEITSRNVKNTFKIGSNLIEVELEEVGHGNIKENLTEVLESLDSRQNEDGDKVFQALFESEYLTVALWSDGNLYYVFDPRPRDETGHIYGKDDWTVIIEEEEEQEKEEEEDEEKVEEPDMDFDEFAGGDSLSISGSYDYEEIGEDEMREEEMLLPSKKGSEYWRQLEVKAGKACILRFCRLTDIVSHIMENTPPTRIEDMEFTLKMIKLQNNAVLHEVHNPEEEKKDEFAGDWLEFKEIDYGRWIIRASNGLYHVMYPEINRGKQEIPACLVALVFLDFYGVEQIKTSVLDTILSYGDRLYTVALKTRYKHLKQIPDLSEEDISTMLKDADFTVLEYPRRLCIDERKSTWEAQTSVICGDLTSTLEEVLNLPQALEAFFKENTYGMVQCRGYSVAIFMKDEIFYMFEPHMVGPNGVGYQGVPCLTRYLKPEDLARTYTENLPEIGDHFYEIHAFSFVQDRCLMEQNPEVKQQKEPKFGGFTQIIPGKYVLRADLKADVSKFDKGVHVHSAAVAFVALAISLTKDPDIWTRLVVNEILNFGEDVYNESIERLGTKFNPWMDSLDICRVRPDFELGRLRVSTALRFREQQGIVDIKNNPKVLNLRQGLEKFFQENSHGVLILERLTLAVWEHTHGEVTNVFLYDPNCRGVTGLPAEGGVACAVKFADTKLMYDHLMACLVGLDKKTLGFRLVPVELVIGTLSSKRKTLCNLSREKPKSSTIRSKQKGICPTKASIDQTKRTIRNAATEERHKKEELSLARLGRIEMYEINSTMAIIRGLRSVAKDRELPVTVIAFVFMKIAADLNKWSYKQIELILEAGNQLYVDSFNAYKPYSTRIDFEHLIRRVSIQTFDIKIGIRTPIQRGSWTLDHLIRDISNIFTLVSFFLLSYKEYFVCICLKSGYYFLFDPYSRDMQGNWAENGCAMLLRCADIETLCANLYRNFNEPDPQSYSFIVLNIDSVSPLPNQTQCA